METRSWTSHHHLQGLFEGRLLKGLGGEALFIVYNFSFHDTIHNVMQ